ncbi:MULTISPECIES: ABC transporter permease [unclassified Mesorhizobium]|uniref:ABC transporter permease n=1 Tax=unclassified Mesorhizobium TaxID=325217 RepID=UPI000FD319AB|nr:MULTISPECIES: ABC transporter permease [unclassified Mesorhizobium]RVB73755.1 ABC transporter permease [Mesorhizobium sp. M6A.T.Cr.TU.014.01.1.1]RWN65653.1 MAG: ABC transporter permease [Mesorhizobium sp.]RWO98061.1 MAG: ABC transporter permease [Mesorhizobium sp.]RWP81432.1 MAG: ABC transporter permease [Mesorhizobium sp.]RWQ02607.1 MAG: ABC transporter permease [Mesorhizobium sp.]
MSDLLSLSSIAPRSWQGFAALALLAGAFLLWPLVDATPGYDVTTGVLIFFLLLLAIQFDHFPPVARAIFLFIGAHGAAWLLLAGITGNEGSARASFYLMLAAAWLLAWRCVTVLSALRPTSRWAATALRLIIPAIFGAWILIIWEAVTRGAGIPFILLPPPSAIGVRIANSLPVLAADVRQTIFKAVIFGYVVGSGAGFLAAIAADRVPFLRRGLLPIGNMVSALPIIGVAPIMVMWFGFDWQSKAAVVIIMTFFPMLVNTVAGLAASGHMERDLMRTYASSYWQTLFKLRLPAAAPFIFNALKINSTLALIGAIVAEFFGTPVVGMGFRISTEVGRMNIDMVWAEIAVAALAGSVFYGVVALFERAVTFWHPSVRGG